MLRGGEVKCCPLHPDDRVSDPLVLDQVGQDELSAIVQPRLDTLLGELALGVMAWGPGRLSLDHWIERRFIGLDGSR